MSDPWVTLAHYPQIQVTIRLFSLVRPLVRGTEGWRMPVTKYPQCVFCPRLAYFLLICCSISQPLRFKHLMLAAMERANAGEVSASVNMNLDPWRRAGMEGSNCWRGSARFLDRRGTGSCKGVRGPCGWVGLDGDKQDDEMLIGIASFAWAIFLAPSSTTRISKLIVHYCE